MGQFYDSLVSLTDWKEVKWEYNCGTHYKHPQNLEAVFHNSFQYVKQKAESFKNREGYLPVKDLRKVCYEFRTHFPTHGRVEGVRYFDEEIEEFILINSFVESSLKWLDEHWKVIAGVLGIIGAIILFLYSKSI